MKLTRAQKIEKEAKPTIDALKAKHKECMICGWPKVGPRYKGPGHLSSIVAHEIANGACRLAARGKPFATLILCGDCNSNAVTDKATWPAERQLSVLLRKAPEDYDLTAYNQIAIRKIHQEDVDTWLTN